MPCISFLYALCIFSYLFVFSFEFYFITRSFLSPFSLFCIELLTAIVTRNNF